MKQQKQIARTYRTSGKHKSHWYVGRLHTIVISEQLHFHQELMELLQSFTTGQGDSSQLTTTTFYVIGNNSTFGSWRSPLGKILDPPLANISVHITLTKLYKNHIVIVNCEWSLRISFREHFRNQQSQRSSFGGQNKVVKTYFSYFCIWRSDLCADLVHIEYQTTDNRQTLH